MLFEMKLHPVPFNLIATGRKDIEMRLFTEERKKMVIGDHIVFTNTCSGKKLEVVVKGLKSFKNFQELYKFYPKYRLGYLNSDEADYHDMNQYYTDENINKFGALAIEIELIK